MLKTKYSDKATLGRKRTTHHGEEGRAVKQEIVFCQTSGSREKVISELSLGPQPMAWCCPKFKWVLTGMLKGYI